MPSKIERPILTQSIDWTIERIGALSTPEARQLRGNADRLGATDIVKLCDEVLATRPRGMANRRKRKPNDRIGRRLVSRRKAFELRNVILGNARSSWGGVRKADGIVVLTLWADGVKRDGAESSYLLWAPNIDGARPWADKPGGIERLKHCKLAAERGEAEGMLVYGEPLEGHLPEDRAATIEGVDSERVLTLKVEQRGAEFWAVWGKASTQNRAVVEVEPFSLAAA